jgi:hypothetical protein
MNVMSIDNLTFGELKQIAAMFGAKPTIETKSTLTNGDERPVIVRSRDAGVQFGYLLGYLLGYHGSEVHLRDARQMWSWKAAKGGTLLDCATYGVSPKESKFSGPVTRCIVLGACAIIDCTPECVDSIGSVKWA